MSAKDDVLAYKKKVLHVEVPALVKTMIIMLKNEVQDRTPVATGWAKSRWRIGPHLAAGVDAPTGTPSDMPDDMPKGEHNLYCYNALPYIKALNEGWSDQAGPGEMVEGAVAVVRNSFGA